MANTARMTALQRREQLIRVGRALFASKGFEAVSVEEIAANAKVSKPIVYEHFGGKEGLYAVIVDREMRELTNALIEALSDTKAHPRQIVERALTKDYRKKIWRPFLSALKDYKLVNDGDRIAVCISGGKDSMLLAKCMQELKRHSPTNFELQFLVMDPGYTPANRQKIVDNAKLRLNLDNDDVVPLSGTDVTGRGQHQYFRLAIVSTRAGRPRWPWEDRPD